MDLRLVVEDSQGIERRLVRNDIDLGFIGAPPTRPELEARHFADDQIVCFAAVHDPLICRARVEPAELSDQLWITRKPGSATRQLFDTWITRAGATVRRTIELDSPEAIKALVAAGVGLSYMSLSGLQRDLEGGRVAAVPIAAADLVRPIYLVRHADKHASPVMEAFVRLVSRQVV